MEFTFISGDKRVPLLLFLSFVLLITGSVIAAPNGTETLISTDVYKNQEYSPVVSGPWIAWSTQDIEDDPSGSLSRYITVVNLSSGQMELIPSASTNWDTAPALSGNTLVYLNDVMGSYQLIAYDLLNHIQLASVSPVATGTDPDEYYNGHPENNLHPRVSGSNIVWQDYSNGNWDIFYYNISFGNNTPVQLIADPGIEEKNPDVSGNLVVYESGSGASSDIYLYNLTDASTIQLTSTSDAVSPAIDRSSVVWQRAEGGRKVAYICTLPSGPARRITPLGATYDQTTPRVSGNRVVLEDTRRDPAYPEIYVYDVSDNSELWISSSGQGSKSMPVISGTKVVWEDRREIYSGSSNNKQIYLFTLGSQDLCPIAGFSANDKVDPPGGTVTFTDISDGGTAGVNYRLWNFSDNSDWVLDSAAVVSRAHSFTNDGVYNVRLTVGNEKCRNISPLLPGYKIYINSPPDAGFDASPEEGFAPLSVQFSDTSTGEPSSYSWSFGDGAVETTQNPAHTFSTSATSYTVTLSATNAHGTSTKQKTVRTFMGSQKTAATPIGGIRVESRFGGSFLVFNGTEIPSFRPAAPTSYVSIRPPQTSNWQNITFLSTEGIGLTDPGGNSTYLGNITRVYLQTNDTVVNAVGTPPSVGSGWGVNYRLNTTRYPDSGAIQTEVWEGATSSDREAFETVARESPPTGTTVRDIAYTTGITRSGIANEGTALLNMSINQSWVQGSASTLGEGRGYTHIIAYGYDSDGNKKGTILDTRYRFSRGTLDFFEAEVPENLNYFSKFALTKLSGSGNPLQLITLTVASHVSSSSSPASSYSPGGSGSDSDSSTGSGSSKAGGAGAAPAAAKDSFQKAPPDSTDTGVTGTIYANAEGVVTQATTLLSTDNKATVSLPSGVIARDANGNPLGSITMSSSTAALQGGSPAPGFLFEGMAYDLGPDGATFSPSISLTFSVPQASWGKDYTVRAFDQKSGAWQDLPTSFDPATGTVTAQVSHFCCFGLFSKIPEKTPVPTPAPVQPAMTESPAPQAPPATAISIFSGMMVWIVDLLVSNTVLVIIMLAGAGAAVWYKRRSQW